MVDADVVLMPPSNQLQGRAAPTCFAHVGARLDPVGSRLVADRDAARPIGQHRHHRNRLTPQRRLQVLLRGGEEGVHVQK